MIERIPDIQTKAMGYLHCFDSKHADGIETIDVGVHTIALSGKFTSHGNYPVEYASVIPKTHIAHISKFPDGETWNCVFSRSTIIPGVPTFFTYRGSKEEIEDLYKSLKQWLER